MSRSRPLSEPSIVDHSEDKATIDAIESNLPDPIVHMDQLARVLKAIWALKRWARHAAAACTEKKKTKKTKKKGGPSAVSILKQRLNLHGLDMISIAADGNCMFRSTAQQLFGSESHHAFVRARAVEYMQSHAALFSAFCVDAADFKRYLNKMARDRTWGDELTLRAICDTFGTTVHVATSLQQQHWYLKYVPDVVKTPKHVFLAYVAPVHYNAFALSPGRAASGRSSGKRQAASPPPEEEEERPPRQAATSDRDTESVKRRKQ